MEDRIDSAGYDDVDQLTVFVYVDLQDQLTHNILRNLKLYTIDMI